MKRFSALFQFILGFFLGVTILVGGTAALAYVVFSRLSTSPPKPIFAEEQPKTSETSQPKEAVKPQSTPTEVKQPPPAEMTAKPSEKPQSTKEEPAATLPNGAYKAKVTWTEGLSLRADSTTESERIGGVAYNYELTVLDTSGDGQWHKVSLADGQEGWIKAGNIQKTD